MAISLLLRDRGEVSDYSCGTEHAILLFKLVQKEEYTFRIPISLFTDKVAKGSRLRFHGVEFKMNP